MIEKYSHYNIEPMQNAVLLLQMITEVWNCSWWIVFSNYAFLCKLAYAYNYVQLQWIHETFLKKL